VLKAFGTLGALDPHRYTEITRRSLLRKREEAQAQHALHHARGAPLAPGALGADDIPAGLGNPAGLAGLADPEGAAPIDPGDGYDPVTVSQAHSAEGDGGKGGRGAGEPLTPSSPEYYSDVAVSALVAILKEPTLHNHHHMAVQAIMFIFQVREPLRESR
jgi:hypothetical protein